MKTKRSISIALLAVVLSFTGYLSYRIIRLQKLRNDAALLPAFTFRTLSGDVFTDEMIKPGYARLVINYFQPDCEYCRDMTGRIRDSRWQLRNTLVIMITEADSAAVLDFVEKYRLKDQDNVMVLRGPALSFYNKFGTAATPCFFVYDQDRRLTKRILGETQIENLVR